MTPDVNVLVAAFRPGHRHHAEANAWLSGAMRSCSAGGALEILPMVAAGFLRIVTNPKIFPNATRAADAIAFLDAILKVPGVTVPVLGPEWSAFRKLCIDLSLAGNEIPDAWIAAAVSAGGLHLVTFDAGFKRLLQPRQYTLLQGRAGVRESRARYRVRRAARPAAKRAASQR